MRLGHGWIVLAEAMPSRLGEALGQDRSAGDLRIIRQKADAISAGQRGQWQHHGQHHHTAEIAHGDKPLTTTNVAGLEKP